MPRRKRREIESSICNNCLRKQYLKLGRIGSTRSMSCPCSYNNLHESRSRSRNTTVRAASAPIGIQWKNSLHINHAVTTGTMNLPRLPLPCSNICCGRYSGYYVDVILVISSFKKQKIRASLEPRWQLWWLWRAWPGQAGSYLGLLWEYLQQPTPSTH